MEEALLSRRSIRAFRSDPVSRDLVERILSLASRAPSGTNVQPWKVYAVAGAARPRLAADAPVGLVFTIEREPVSGFADFTGFGP